MAEQAPDSTLLTRQSLLARLREDLDQEGWREFFDRYWRLIYNVARQAGLNDAAAQDVVQETFVYLTRRMPQFQYDPGRGSFKGWLRSVVRTHIGRVQRAASRNFSIHQIELGGEGDVGGLDSLADPAAGEVLEKAWNREWEENLIQNAYRRVRPKVSAQQLLIFRLATQEGLTLSEVAAKLDINIGQVYLARHRVGRLLKAEVSLLRRDVE